MSQSYQRFESVIDRIRAAAAAADRDPEEIRLLAVSKKHPLSAIRELHAAGVRSFGENYAAEALPKIEALSDLDLEWHYIGPVQSNKTRQLAEHFHWVESIDREKILRRLANQRPEHLPPLNCCIQVRIGDEATKSGASPELATELAAMAGGLPRLRLRGLMAIPPPSDDFDVQRGYFAQLKRLYDQLRSAGLALDTLSMGMSSDLEAAIHEGATLVRIGTALFGPRPA
ncbi:MAG: YggS family pyridoxal phosphate-dependent enzyme [Xanthomonadales bacterium]|nr:YggS family pyridoxal phosphate-dependent enzyme [Xanthomonadales bacterium]